MVVPVILYGSPVLRKHSAEVVEVDNILKINEVLFDTLKKNEGIGLAAPQVNLSKRVFVIDTTPMADDEINIEKFTGIFFNPEIIDFSTDFSVYKEGCLSIPEIHEDVDRPVSILVRYSDSLFNTIEEELNGIKARIFQHEYDHLEGMLFIDRINSIRRKIISPKLNKIRKLARKSFDYYG